MEPERKALFRKNNGGCRFEEDETGLYAFDRVTGELVAAIYPNGAGRASGR